MLFYLLTAKNKSGSFRPAPTSFCYGPIYLFLFWLYCWLACLYCPQVIASDWSVSDRNNLESIKNNAEMLKQRLTVDYNVGNLNKQTSGALYNLVTGSKLRLSTPEQMNGSVVNAGYENLLTGNSFSGSYSYDRSMLDILHILGVQFGILRYSTNSLSGFQQISNNHITLYEALLGWDGPPSWASEHTNGIVYIQSQINSKMDNLTNELHHLEKMDIITNQLQSMLANQTNMIFLTAAAQNITFDALMTQLEEHRWYDMNSFSASPYSSIVRLPEDEIYSSLDGNLLDYYFALSSHLDVETDFGKIYHSYYGNLRAPSSIDPGINDDVPSWKQNATSFVDTAPNSDMNEVPADPSEPSWVPDASPQVAAYLIKPLNDTTDGLEDLPVPDENKFAVLRTAFNRVVSNGNNPDSLGIDFHLTLGSSSVDVVHEFASVAPIGFMSNLKQRFTSKLSGWADLVSVFCLVALWLRTVQIVLSSFNGDSVV